MLQNLIGPIASILDKVIVDKDKKAELAHEIATLAERQAQEIALAQISVNTAEAGSGNWFRAGWRPATGWVCVAGFAVNFFVSPLASGFGYDIPQADTSVMLPVLMGMLGLGGLRTFERVKGLT